jgi:hypothetical protein
MTTKKRPGRPKLGKDGAIRVLVTLDQQTIDRASKLGGGNVSAGIRKALAQKSKA